MKSKFLIAALVLLTMQMQAQEKVCKRVNDIATMERQANDKKNKNGLRSLASGNFSVNYYKCEWTIDPANNYITGKVTPHFIVIGSANSLVFDLSNALIVDSVYMRGNKLGFSQSSNQTLTIQLPSAYKNGRKDSLTIFYQGAPVGGGFGSFVKSTHNGTPVLWTLSEPYGAKDWWPCRNGLDDKADSIDIYVTHPSVYRASSNGLLISAVKNGSTTTSFFKHRYAIASYLVAIAVTNYSVFTDYVQLGNVNMPVISNVYPEDSATFHSAVGSTLNALRLYSTTFSKYPFINERYGITQFGWGGGMEHQTNSFIVSTGENLETHELAHQWFGDKVTCGSWQDIWLNEGFATFCADFLYTENYNPTLNKLYIKNDLDYIVSQPGGSVKVDDTTSTGRIFDGRLSYDKGAFLLRMLRFTMGDQLFFKGIKKYLNDPLLKFNFAHTADLQRNLEAVSGLDLSYFFDQWFIGQGYPSFTVQWSQDAGNEATVHISQTTSHPSVSFFRVPLTLTFKNATQQKTITVQHTVNNQVVLDNIGFKADTVLIDPDMQLVSKNNKTIHTLSKNPADINAVSVSPNPFTDRINVSVKEAAGKKILLQLFDNAGHIVANSMVTNSSNNQNNTLVIPHYVTPGSYILHVTVNDMLTIHNVIKK
ncbi:MAG TPA: M1 family metallopeptidase [Panacibacter sp.]|nr:M1 family metallopeptidase [Panacibacter sp.]